MEVYRNDGIVVKLDAADYWGIYDKEKWHLDGRKRCPYLCRRDRKTRKRVWLHQEVAGYEKPDHINGDQFDNHRSNVRPATYSQNAMNMRVKKDGYKGVSSNRGKFRARITKDYKIYELGTFSNAEDAALAYNKAATEMFGEFACLNEVRK